MLITPEYVEQNKQLHAEREDYGVGGRRHAPVICEMLEAMGLRSVLDYGCGKATLHKTVTQLRGIDPMLVWQDYDPAVADYAIRPRPAELVVCTDVLEHIEPDRLDAVLADLAHLTKKMAFFTVATRPAMKMLPDGRNAHLIIEKIDWWLPKLMQHWTLRNVIGQDGEFLFMGERRP